MSEINSLIATSTIIAYNTGRKDGEHQEHKKIVALVNNYKNKPDFTFDNLLALMETDSE